MKSGGTQTGTMGSAVPPGRRRGVAGADAHRGDRQEVDAGSAPPSDDATACTQAPDKGLYAFADLKLDTTGAPSGGISAVLTHLSVLGVDPGSWTTAPLVG